MNKNKFSLIIHGGAGLITNKKEYEISIIDILKQGRKRLQKKDSALDVVEHCVKMLEDNPHFNAGRGSVLNENGKVELDASIMDGKDMSAGSIASVYNIKNPISLARRVLMKSKHVFLIGSGAMKFAELENKIIETAKDSYFITKSRVKQLKDATTANSIYLDHSQSQKKMKENKLGTVGAVAFDMNGNLAAATSTGGLVNKKFGRVGDSPIVGSGVFADNETCAVSCTGIGEDILRTNLAKVVSDFMLIGKLNIKDASKKAIKYFTKKIGGIGGFIAIGKDGEIALEFTTDEMIYGFTTEKKDPSARFDKIDMR